MSSSGSRAAEGRIVPAVTDVPAGDLIDGCEIDLPSNDVFEAIEFDRFLLLNGRLQDFQRPVTLLSAWISMSRVLSTEDVVKVAPELARGAPLSRRKRDWEIPPAAEGDTKDLERSDVVSESADPSIASAAAGEIPDIGGYTLAFYLPYRQEWALLGYSRGRMVNSVTLGPQEVQTIEILKWSESSGTRRDTTDISRDIARQAGFELTSNARVGFKVEVVNADFSSGMNAKAGLNDAERKARMSITEATSRAATNVRSSRTLEVAEARESGEELRVTRKLRNHNTCHTLTTSFFEILANYRVSTCLRTDAIRIVVLLKSSDLSGRLLRV